MALVFATAALFLDASSRLILDCAMFCYEDNKREKLPEALELVYPNNHDGQDPEGSVYSGEVEGYITDMFLNGDPVLLNAWGGDNNSDFARKSSLNDTGLDSNYLADSHQTLGETPRSSAESGNMSFHVFFVTF